MKTEHEYEDLAFAELQKKDETLGNDYTGTVRYMADRFGQKEVLRLAFNMIGHWFIQNCLGAEMDDAYDEVTAQNPDLEKDEMMKAMYTKVDAWREDRE